MSILQGTGGPPESLPSVGGIPDFVREVFADVLGLTETVREAVPIMMDLALGVF